LEKKEGNGNKDMRNRRGVVFCSGSAGSGIGGFAIRRPKGALLIFFTPQQWGVS